MNREKSLKGQRIRVSHKDCIAVGKGTLSSSRKDWGRKGANARGIRR